jgi:hypothetical protein
MESRPLRNGDSCGYFFAMPLLEWPREEMPNSNRQEEAFRVEIVFPKFISDADLAVLEGSGIGKSKIDLPLMPPTMTIQLPKTRNLTDLRLNHQRLNLRE